MRIGRTKQPPAKPAPEIQIDLAALAQKRLRDQYVKGLEDGTLITLDMIEGTNLDDNVGMPYQGPLPDELREYIARVRENARG